MKVERTKDEIFVRLSLKTNISDLQEMIDYFEYKEATAKSQANQSDFDALVTEVKQGWWAKNRGRFIK